ncbi:hypothetical protein F4808DRAFT_462114 [Astrocystis sublimbata]|nr:hypothetical protein F4808DRAFT_462114 [Astrocystis sublimbata]
MSTQSTKKAFEFTYACQLITERMVKDGDDPVVQWKRWLRLTIQEDLDAAAASTQILGSRSVAKVQQDLAHRLWKSYFPRLELPWQELELKWHDPLNTMDMALIKHAQGISRKDPGAALAILTKNSMEIPSDTAINPPEQPTNKPDIKVAVPLVPATQAISKPGPSSGKPLVILPKDPTTEKPEKPKAQQESNKPSAAAPKPVTKVSGSDINVPGHVQKGTPKSIEDRINLKEFLDKKLGGIQDEALKAALAVVRNAMDKKAAEDFEQDFPSLPTGTAQDLGHSPSLQVVPYISGSIPVASGARPPPSNPSAPPVSTVKCLFDPWLDTNGNPMGCLPGVGPSEIPLPDNFDPLILLPIKKDIESWLNVDLFFHSRDKGKGKERQTSLGVNRIQVLPEKCRGESRLKEVDSYYGMLAVHILWQWTRDADRRGRFMPILTYLKNGFLAWHCAGSMDSIFASITGKEAYLNNIEPIDEEEMKSGGSVAPMQTLTASTHPRGPYHKPNPTSNDGKPPSDTAFEPTNYLSWRECFMEALEQQPRMRALLSGKELEEFRDVVSCTSTEFGSGSTLHVSTMFKHVNDRYLSVFPEKIVRPSIDDYDEIWELMPIFLQELVRVTSKKFGFKVEFFKHWEEVEGPIKNKLVQMGIPQSAPKKNTEKSTSGITTLYQRPVGDGSLRMVWYETVVLSDDTTKPGPSNER